MIRFIFYYVITALLLIAGVSSAFGQKSEKIVDLLNSAHPKAVAGQKGWGFQKTSSVDLNNDAVQEQVFLIANVSLNKGEPIWDDGQVWQVYIQSAKGQRTYIYSRFVQLGHVEVLTTREEPNGGHTILILERMPHAFSVYEVHYCGHENFRVVQLVNRSIDPRLTPASPQNKTSLYRYRSIDFKKK